MVISMVPVFPPEIWLIIVDHLRGEDNPQHISRLSQTCRWLYQEINHLIYRSVRLNWEMNVLGFGQTVFNRPQLAGLVKQVRYAIDMGSNSFTSRYSPFYKLLPRLYNLRTLNLRKDFYPDEKTNIRTRSKDLLDGLLDGKGLSQVRRDGCVQLSKTFKDVTKGGNHSRLERAAFISAGELFLKYHTAGSYMDDVTICLRCDQDGLKDLIPALRTCELSNSETD